MDVLRAHAQLLWWLGPWAPSDRSPEGVERHTVIVPARTTGEREFEAWAYVPSGRDPTGTLLVCPGLHYLGPADPRLDRFLRILASAGLYVLSPFLPDFIDLAVRPSLVSDLERAFQALLDREERPEGVLPGIFSISFGSLPALRLASMTHRAHEIGGVMVFGGYADFGEALRFCLTGKSRSGDARPHDPLNRPVALMNLLPHAEEAPEDPEPLYRAWREYVESTWGRPEMKVADRHRAVAERIERGLSDPRLRHLFRVGVGLEEGALELCERALAKGGVELAELDPRPHLSGLRCPVHLVHGMDDDVIPHTELDELARAMPPHVTTERYLTGLYGHTESAPLSGLVGGAREAATLLRMLRALVRLGSRSA